jgi:hypothetical protein
VITSAGFHAADLNLEQVPASVDFVQNLTSNVCYLSRGSLALRRVYGFQKRAGQRKENFGKVSTEESSENVLPHGRSQACLIAFEQCTPRLQKEQQKCPGQTVI